MSFCRVLKIFCLVITLFGHAALGGQPSPECENGRQKIFFSAHPLLDTRFGNGFTDTLRSQLKSPLAELGYCLVDIKEYILRKDSAQLSDNLVLHSIVSEGPDPFAGSLVGSGTFLVAALNIHDWAAGKLPEAISRPLVTLRYHASEIPGLPNILVKKIAENLRSQFVAQLLIQSRPAGAIVHASSGLEGVAPVEWVVPLGEFSVTLESKGYLSIRRDLDLSTPGSHSFEMQMVKRRFYHSKFIYPALVFGAASGLAYIFESYFYSAYRDLGPQDQQDHPERFSKTFHTAKILERTSYGALFASVTCLAFSFRF